MKKALLVALMGLMTIITANAAVDFQNITITLKDGQVIKYEASQLDHVTYVGGEFGEEGAVGIKLYITATTSEDYLYQPQQPSPASPQPTSLRRERGI